MKSITVILQIKNSKECLEITIYNRSSELLPIKLKTPQCLPLLSHSSKTLVFHFVLLWPRRAQSNTISLLVFCFVLVTWSENDFAQNNFSNHFFNCFSAVFFILTTLVFFCLSSVRYDIAHQHFPDDFPYFQTPSHLISHQNVPKALVRAKTAYNI